MNDKVLELFEQGKLLARAMGNPDLFKYGDKGIVCDFSVWAEEYEIAKKKDCSAFLQLYCYQEKL